MTRSAFNVSSRLARAATVSLALALSLSVSHQALAACNPAGAGAFGNTYDNTANVVVCNDANAPGTNTTAAANAAAVVNLAGDNDTLAVNGNPIFQNSTIVNGAGNFTQAIIDGGDGNDLFNFNGGEFRGVINGGTGNDKFNINGGLYRGNLNSGAGNDLVVIDDLTSTANLTAGTGVASQGDTDRIFMFGGNITGGEVQIGAGQNNYFFFMGGTIQKSASGAGSIEVNRGSVGTVIVFDGGTVNLDEGIEVQSGNATQLGPKDPTIYFRSGVYEAGELELAGTDSGGMNPTNWTVNIDPINSKSAAYFQALANAATGANDPTLSTANLNSLLFSAPDNPDAVHVMTFKTAEIELGAGIDKLTFNGAVNNGDGHHNLVLQGAEEEPGEFEVTELGGGAGDDTLTVMGKSNLLLGEVEDFEHLFVIGGSKLTLASEDGEGEHEFEDEVVVDGTSELHLQGTEFEFSTNEFTLLSGAGSGRLEGLPDYYTTFATGGILRIGALPGAEGDEEDEEEEEEASEKDEGGGPATVVFTGDGNTFNNGGTIVLMNGVVGDTFAINDHYVSAGGNLAVDTELGGSGSPTDKLVINGPVDGVTKVFVNNVGGTGAFTGQGEKDGIAVAVSGTDAFAPNSFKLAVNSLTGQEEVVAGAFSYRLAVTDDAALLQSDILDQVPAYATAPSVGQRLVSTGLDTLYKRLGEIRDGRNNGATSADGLLWVRGSYSDVDVDVSNGFDFSQRSSGVIAGAGGVLASEGGSRLAVGIFGSYGTADASVDAVIFGAASHSSVDADGYGGGAYATYYELGRPGTGLYVDTVVKADFLSFDMSTGARAAKGSADGDALTASAEAGYGFGIGGGMVIQPQAQIAYTSLSIDGFTDAAPYNVDVSYGTSESLIGRLGLQLQANLVQPGGGVISPYALVNVYSEFEGDNRSQVAGTEFVSDVGGTWYSAGGGVTAQLANALSLYGSGEYHFGDVEGWQGTGGLKLNW